MNCRKFETIINELAHERLMDAGSRESGLAHAKECARCALRLADERALTAGLRAIKANCAGVEAPAHLEDTLLAAFRERKEVAPVAPVVVPLAGRRRRWQYWSSRVSIAAMVLLAVTLSLSRWQTPTMPGPVPEQASHKPEPESGPVAVSNIAGPDSTTGGPELSDNTEGPIQRRPGVMHGPAYQFASNQTRARSISRRDEGSEGTHPFSNTSPNDGNNAGQQEITTDFLPLTYDSNVASMDSGHIVRVELPRSALASMGLPMNIERAGEPVKADVLLGEDGVARAIRFVR